jgi:Skp family chaperone for outer membrane proteins
LQKEDQALKDRAAALQAEVQKEVSALQEEELVLNNRISELIENAIKEINADKKYKMILNSAKLLGAVLDADESLDITELVLAKVNELYATEKK